MTKQIPTVGLDFIAADGRRYTTCQLLKDGKAIAIANFTDGKLAGHRNTYEADMGSFLAACSGLLANSIPQQFSVAPRGWESIEGGLEHR